MNTLEFADLETAYETLAQAIDVAGPHREALFLTKLALVLAHETGNLSLFRKAVETALQDVAEPVQVESASLQEGDERI